MKKVIIYGNNDIGSLVKQILEIAYFPLQNMRDVKVIGFTEANPENLGERDGLPVIYSDYLPEMIRTGEVDSIVLPRDNYGGSNKLASYFLSMGVIPDHLYLTKRITQELVDSPQLLKDFLEPFLQASYLPYLEFHLADHCNLNCAYCEHYSGLVEEEIYPEYEKLTADFKQLKKYIDDIGMIRLLGGEPLLNPDINRYLYFVRDLYPNAEIFVVTNALKLMHMPEDFFEALRKTNSFIHISFYKPMESKMDEITAFLKKNNIGYTISPLMDYFTKKQVLEPHDHATETFLNCLQAHCRNLYDGKIAACFLPFTTKYFNRYFDKNIPEEGAIDLYDPNLNTEILKVRLLTPMKRCAYCDTEERTDWRQISKPSVLEDWVKL